MKTRIGLILSLLVFSALALGAMPDSALAGKTGNDFSRLVVDMVRFHALGILQGDYKRGVTFNTAFAKQYGFSEPAIRLGE